MGPRLVGYSAVNVGDQTEVEIRSRQLMAQHLAVYREHAPGFAGAYLMLSAPQLGVRHARRLVGVGRVTREDWADGAPHPDEVGISPSLSPKFPLVSVPYGCLVPRDIDGLLVAGRHISRDATSHSFLREIPQCWLTDQVAGAAAALVAAEKSEPRAVSTAAGPLSTSADDGAAAARCDPRCDRSMADRNGGAHPGADRMGGFALGRPDDIGNVGHADRAGADGGDAGRCDLPAGIDAALAATLAHDADHAQPCGIGSA